MITEHRFRLYYVRCDNCKKPFSQVFTKDMMTCTQYPVSWYKNLLELLNSLDWKIRVGPDKVTRHFCPDCKVPL